LLLTLPCTCAFAVVSLDILVQGPVVRLYVRSGMKQGAVVVVKAIGDLFAVSSWPFVDVSLGPSGCQVVGVMTHVAPLPSVAEDGVPRITLAGEVP